MFTLPRAFGLQVRLRALSSGNAMLTLDAGTGPDSAIGNQGSRNFEVTRQWRDVVLRAADFHHDGVGRTLDSGGWAVQTLCIWGLTTGEIEVESITLGELSEP